MFNLDMTATNFLWNKAYVYMLAGHKITSVEWEKDDYIYMENNVIYCDGGFPYLEHLAKEIIDGQWNLYKGSK